MITIDVESEAIAGNPIVNPPRLVGVAIKRDDEPAEYHTEPWAMERALVKAYASSHDLLFHNAPFDLSVIRKHFGLEWPRWDRIHDTMFLLFLNDPHSRSLALKEAGKELLGIEPGEQADLRDWVLENVPQATKKSWGAWISRAPHELVAPYAKQDVELTYQLYQKLSHLRGPAYDLERELQPHLVEATRRGVRVDVDKLLTDTAQAEADMFQAERRMCDMIGCEALNFDAGAEVLAALQAARFISDERLAAWPRTPKSGKPKTSRDVMLEQLSDHPALGELIAYRGAMHTVINTFMKGWLALSAADGRVHPEWNQVRSSRAGTRTGRMSCEAPNLMNVPTEFTQRIPNGLMPIPNMRDYLLPEEGCEWISRDFAAQEIRILAHFEKQLHDESRAMVASTINDKIDRDGAGFADGSSASRPVLWEAFDADPGMDPHEMVRGLIGADSITRKQVKGVAFAMLYGMGANGLGQVLGVSKSKAQALINAYLQAVPGAEKVQNWTRSRGTIKAPIITAGGREYYSEQDKAYKLTNYLIQGSAADQTKACMLAYFKTSAPGSVFLCAVHDELNISVPIGQNDDDLRQAMEHGADDMISVPMVTTLKRGKTWGSASDQEA